MIKTCPVTIPLIQACIPLCFQCLLYEIITGVRSAGGTDNASSSSAPATVSTTKSVDELLSEIAPVTILAVCALVSVYITFFLQSNFLC